MLKLFLATQEIARNVQQASAGTVEVATKITDVNRGASETGAAWQLIMAGTLLTTMPLLLAFFAFQRQFINSFVQSGLR